METLINLLVNNGVAVVIVAYFLFKDNKFNNELVKTLTEITLTLKMIKDDITKTRENTEILKDDKGE